MVRIAWGLTVAAGLVFLALFVINTEQTSPACRTYVSDMGLLVLCAFTISGAVDFVRRGQAQFAAALAGGTIAVCGYAVLSHGWL